MNNHIQTLKRFNAWRRCDDVMDQPNSKAVGEALDWLIDHYVALERDRDEWKEEADMRSKEIDIWKHEAQLLRDELKIADKAIEDNTSMIFKLMDENRKSSAQISIAKNDWIN
jgi:septal ring factor EnvC (AmiA/AmiB activator)